MWTTDKNFPARGFSTPPPHTGKSRRWSPGTPVRPLSEKKVWNSTRAKADLFHVIHKVPSGDSPYVRAKHVQLIEKDPSKAISLFWAAINSGDRVDSALKDMAVAMKQLNRSDEAIEAIKSFRHLCPLESQESLDNVLVELYKRSGRIEEQIEMLQHKVKTIEEGMAFGGKRTKAARSQGKKIQITIDQEYSRLLGNLAWAYLQQNNFKSAEELYRKALSLESDKNKQCNLAICLMHLNRTTEAKILLQSIRPSLIDGQLDESYARSFERATQMLTEIESREAAGLLKKGGSYSENCSNISFADPLKKGSYNENPYERTADFGSKGTGGIEIGSSYKKTYGSPFLPARGIPKVPFTQPRRAFWGDQRRDFPGDDAVGGFNRKLSFEQPIMRHGNFEMSKATLQKSESGSPCFSGDWKKRSWRDLDEVNRESSLQPIEDDVKLTEELQSQCNSVAGNLEHSQDISICKSKKAWADMVEEDEQELLSGINHCQEWNSGEEGFNDENMNSSNIIYHQTLTPFDQIEKLSENIESFDLKDGYHTQPETADSSMNQTVRRSLCFDQQQKTDRTDNYCSSTLPKKVLNFEGYGSFLEKEREFTSGNGIKLLRRNRLKVFRDITLSSESPRP